MINITQGCKNCCDAQIWFERQNNASVCVCGRATRPCILSAMLKKKTFFRNFCSLASLAGAWQILTWEGVMKIFALDKHKPSFNSRNHVRASAYALIANGLKAQPSSNSGFTFFFFYHFLFFWWQVRVYINIGARIQRSPTQAASVLCHRSEPRKGLPMPVVPEMERMKRRRKRKEDKGGGRLRVDPLLWLLCLRGRTFRLLSAELQQGRYACSC